MQRDTRTALLDAAQERFATAGFVGTSIRDLASAVGIKESSVYNHFASKQAVLDAVLARADERLAQIGNQFGIPLDDAAAATPIYQDIPIERLEEIAVGFLNLWLHDQDFVAARRILTLEQYRTPEAGQRLRAMLVDEPLAFQSALFAELIRREFFRPADPTAVALAFWGPILAILTKADGAEDEADARRLLHIHLVHFKDTYVLADNPDEES